MKLYIANQYNMKSYKLPDEINESFLISYTSVVDGEEKIIYIKAINGKWQIDSNLNIGLFHNRFPQNEIILEEYKTFVICFNDCEEYVFLICVPSTDEVFKDYSIPLTQNQILIGSGDNNHLVYKNSLVNDQHILLQRDDQGIWYINVNDNTSSVYVNKVVTKKRQLNFGDEIFVFGLKILWMKSFIRVTLVGNNFFVNGLDLFDLPKIDNSTFTPTTAKEKNQVLYKESDYFFHTPSLKPVVENKKITIAPVPMKDESGQKNSFVLSIATSLSMSVVSIITALQSLNRISTHKSTLSDEFVVLISTCVMLFTSLAIPIITELYNRRKDLKNERRRVEVYTAYIDSKEEELNNFLSKKLLALRDLYPSTQECISTIVNKTPHMWSREIKDEEFLSIRFGVGDTDAGVEIDYKKPEYVLKEDKLEEKVNRMVSNDIKLHEAPIVTSLVRNNVFPIIMNCFDKKGYIENIILQLMAFHSSYDLKIVFLVDEKNSYIWDGFKYLSHCISNDKDHRFFAYSDDELKECSSYLENIYQSRVMDINQPSSEDNGEKVTVLDDADIYKKFDTYYLIVTDNILHVKNFGIVDRLLRSSSNYGFSLLIFEDSIKNLPSRCNVFVNVKDNEAQMFNKEVTGENQKEFLPEFLKGVDINHLISQISNVPVASPEAASQLPTSLEFLEMYKAGKIEQLNISNCWQSNDPTLSLSAPIGVHPDGNIFELDLHEKSHGPHGLVAGSTGSGKSEFIITYVLSMCINYSPNEVQFVLIDYKGGGLAGAFENREKGLKIPHLVGTITNLDTSEMNRTLVSIRSELKRRQRMFNEVRDALGESTIDIYKYQKYFREGSVSEPIAHLFIISDEFAELKSQQPEFMDELISTARIGRSLGVHLILATQKPSGVVDDQIWSNMKFKVCLKVQSASDSIEMLKRPEAASIKETGRFYLQVGYDEIFDIGQSAWAGAKYVPTDVITKKIDDSIDFINNVGISIKTINNVVKKEDSIELGEQLTNIVKYLIDLSNKENIRPNQLWLPSIPNEIYLGNVINKYAYKAQPFKLEAVIGEYDDPENQKQNVFIHNLVDAGNTGIYGIAGCGKENLLTTMMYSICMFHSPSEINFYIMDFGAEVLKVFGKMPQVGEYITTYDVDKVPSMFGFLEKELAKRKKILSDFGGNYSQYVSKNEEKMPLICTILNGYESYMDNFDDTVDTLTKLMREGAKMGIVFIITAASSNTISGRVFQNFTTVFGMRFNDDFEFRYLLSAEPGQVPKKVFGRGLTKIEDRVLEFQTALVNVSDEINETIKKAAVSLASHYKDKAKSIPVVPGRVSSSTLSENITDVTEVPLGVNINDISTATFDFKNNQLVGITGNDVRMGNTFVEEFLKMLAKIPDTNVVLLDLFRTTDVPQGIKSTTIAYEFAEAAEASIPASEQPEGHRIVVITGVGELFTDDSQLEAKEKIVNIINDLDKYKNTSFVLIDDYFEYRKIIVENWYQSKYDETTGIWIGNGIDSQIAFTINGLTNDDTEQYTDDIGYLIKKSKYELIKIMESDDSV